MMIDSKKLRARIEARIAQLDKEGSYSRSRGLDDAFFLLSEMETERFMELHQKRLDRIPQKVDRKLKRQNRLFKIWFRKGWDAQIDGLGVDKCPKLDEHRRTSWIAGNEGAAKYFKQGSATDDP